MDVAIYIKGQCVEYIQDATVTWCPARDHVDKKSKGILMFIEQTQEGFVVDSNGHPTSFSIDNPIGSSENTLNSLRMIMNRLCSTTVLEYDGNTKRFKFKSVRDVVIEPNIDSHLLLLDVPIEKIGDRLFFGDCEYETPIC